MALSFTHILSVSRIWNPIVSLSILFSILLLSMSYLKCFLNVWLCIFIFYSIFIDACCFFFQQTLKRSHISGGAPKNTKIPLLGLIYLLVDATKSNETYSNNNHINERRYRRRYMYSQNHNTHFHYCTWFKLLLIRGITATLFIYNTFRVHLVGY